ncbi:MAG: hypothetical protein GF317_03990 [Candidatus Lokiarchaeota archaeon]|nr:hypothetical protein [Candidatus Lokiarchaeota archaeon]MBD3199047.1 hypothetical protein [Candidatus Lokiarchaeota archaeon]
MDEEYLENDLASIDEISELPISAFKFLDKKEARVITEIFKTSNIKDLGKLDKNEPMKNYFEQSKSKKNSDISQDIGIKFEIYKKKYANLEDHLKKAIILSSLLIEVEGETQVLDKNTQKIIVVGLQLAGKTSIINRVGLEKGIEKLSNLEPTKGVNRQTLHRPNYDLIIWDFGGQEKYRDKYLQDPERYFLQIDLLIYVIDVQDSERFDETFEYFEKIIDIIKVLEENPYILILIHKFDPDIADDPKILLNVELVKDKINEIFRKKQYNYEYETYATSIYSTLSREPKFSKYVKDVINARFSLTDPTIRKVEALGKTLEETMNAVIRLSESLTQDLNEIDARLNAIESGAFHIAQSGVPLEIRSSDQIRESSELNVRSNVLNELKELFAKKKKLDQ